MVVGVLSLQCIDSTSSYKFAANGSEHSRRSLVANVLIYKDNSSNHGPNILN